MKKNLVSILTIGITGAVAGIIGSSVNYNKQLLKKQKLSDKHLALFLLMNQWVKIKQEGKSISAFLGEKGYRKIAIYGMSYVGETLLRELKNSAINVECAIDKNVDMIYSEIDVIGPDSEIPEVDAVIVTAVSFFEEIKTAMKYKTKADILSLEDILYEI